MNKKIPWPRSATKKTVEKKTKTMQWLMLGSSWVEKPALEGRHNNDWAKSATAVPHPE